MNGRGGLSDGQELCHIRDCRGFLTRFSVTTGHEIEYEILFYFRLSSKIGGPRSKTIITAK